MQVLTYHFKNDTKLQLGNHPWEPVLEDGHVNLHIFSEPERSSSEDHIRHAFQESMGLFVGVDLILRRLPEPPNLQDPSEKIPVDLHIHELELQDLVQRQRWLAVLGRGIKDGRDVNSIWYDPVPFSSANSCAGSGGGNNP